MRPWCTPVRGHLQLVRCDCVHNSETKHDHIQVQLSARQEDAKPSTLRGIRYALLLLIMLTRVDFCSWVHVLSVHCEFSEDSSTMLMEADSERQLIYNMYLDERDFCDGFHCVADMVADFFTDPNLPPPNAHLLSVALRQITSRGAIDRCRSVREQLDIPVIMAICSDVRNAFLERLWRSLKALQSRHGGWRFPVRVPDELRLEFAFVIWPMDIELYGGPQTQASALLVEEIVTRGSELKIDQINLATGTDFDVPCGAAQSAQTIGRVLERLFCASRCSKN